MERVTDVLNNIYNTGMGHLENRRKQRQLDMQGHQFALDQQLKQAQLGGAMQDQKLKQFQLDRISGQGGQQFTPGPNMRVKEYDAYGLPKSYEPSDKLTAGQKLQKDKATLDLYETIEDNKQKQIGIDDAREAVKKVPQGLMGKAQYAWNKYFDPTDPMLSDFQKIRMVGTDAQLLNTAKTKGAISDREMALFAEAAANDDFISVARLKPVLDKLERFIESQNSAKMGAYQKNYGEDPREWFKNPKNVDKTPSFSSEQEAEASGIKGPVLINGKKAVIE